MYSSLTPAVTYPNPPQTMPISYTVADTPSATAPTYSCLSSIGTATPNDPLNSVSDTDLIPMSDTYSAYEKFVLGIPDVQEAQMQLNNLKSAVQAKDGM